MYAVVQVSVSICAYVIQKYLKEQIRAKSNTLCNLLKYIPSNLIVEFNSKMKVTKFNASDEEQMA